MLLNAFLFYQFRWLLEGSGIKVWDFNLVTFRALFLPYKYIKYHSFPEETKPSLSLYPSLLRQWTSDPVSLGIRMEIHSDNFPSSVAKEAPAAEPLCCLFDCCGDRTTTKTFFVPFSCVPESLHFFWLRAQLVHYGKQEETLGQLLLRRETCKNLGFKCENCVNWLLSKCRGKLMSYLRIVRCWPGQRSRRRACWNKKLIFSQACYFSQKIFPLWKKAVFPYQQNSRKKSILLWKFVANVD